MAESDAPDLLPTVVQANADLAFVRELDDIRMKRSTWIAEEGGKGHFDTAGAPPAYRVAFKARGFDVLVDAAVAERIAASNVKSELVVALDDWATLEVDETIRHRVLAVAAKADVAVRLGPKKPRYRENVDIALKLKAERDAKTAPPPRAVKRRSGL